jgi:hypothetical protein
MRLRNLPHASLAGGPIMLRKGWPHDPAKLRRKWPHDPANRQADVTMTWTIDGVDSAERCAAHGAALVEISILGPAGQHVDTLVHRCFAPLAVDTLDRSFLAEGVGVRLPVTGDHSASARLKDADGRAITTAVNGTLHPGVPGAGAEVNFEFHGTFTNGNGADEPRD